MDFLKPKLNKINHPSLLLVGGGSVGTRLRRLLLQRFTAAAVFVVALDFGGSTMQRIVAAVWKSLR